MNRTASDRKKKRNFVGTRFTVGCHPRFSRSIIQARLTVYVWNLQSISTPARQQSQNSGNWLLGISHLPKKNSEACGLPQRYHIYMCIPGTQNDCIPLPNGLELIVYLCLVALQLLLCQLFPVMVVDGKYDLYKSYFSVSSTITTCRSLVAKPQSRHPKMTYATLQVQKHCLAHHFNLIAQVWWRARGNIPY